MSKIYKATGAAALLLSLVLSSCTGDIAAPPELKDTVMVSYDTATVTRGDVSQVILYEAYVRATVENLSFGKSNGVLGAVYAAVGDSVKKGDLLAVMDVSAAESSIESARAALKAREERLAYDRRLKQIDIEIAKLNLDETRASGGETEIGLAEFAVTRLETELKQLTETANLELSNLRSQLAKAETALEDTEIYAPFDGEVVSVTAKTSGQRVSTADVIIMLADTTRLYVQYDGTDNISTSRGSYSALVGAEEYPLIPVVYEHSEYVTLVLSGRKPAPRFDFEQLPENIAPGDFAALLSVQNTSPDTLKIPVNSLYTGGGKSYVYRITDGEKLYTEVTVGIRNGAFVEIKSGLSEGDEVLVKQ